MKSNKEKSIGRWDQKEHIAFLTGLKQYGKNWKKLEECIPTRDSVQIRSHAQKFFNRKSIRQGLKDISNLQNQLQTNKCNELCECNLKNAFSLFSYMISQYKDDFPKLSDLINITPLKENIQVSPIINNQKKENSFKLTLVAQQNLQKGTDYIPLRKKIRF